MLILYERISFLGLTRDSQLLCTFDFTKLRHISICIDHFIVHEPATLYDLRARIIPLVDIFRKVSSKFRDLDISFVDEQLSDRRIDPVWATEENYVRVPDLPLSYSWSRFLHCKTAARRSRSPSSKASQTLCFLSGPSCGHAHETLHL